MDSPRGTAEEGGEASRLDHQDEEDRHADEHVLTHVQHTGIKAAAEQGRAQP